MERLGIDTGKPLADMQRYVEQIRAAERPAGTLPPIYLATLRNRMLDLALAHADGAIWANASLRHMPDQVARVPQERRDSFFLANMVPTVIHRRTLAGYVTLSNYRDYSKQAGYEDEMAAIEDALSAGDRERLPVLMTDEWLDDCTISGSPGEVRERLAAWAATGVLPIAVMSSTTGGQAKAIGELFALYE
jgi:alkanesulfonate monooxygenase SsuD/methylene tetrahydromethanopterin reductase-like flavin-dependent oxidoreductase (luciferase family)